MSWLDREGWVPYQVSNDQRSGAENLMYIQDPRRAAFSLMKQQENCTHWSREVTRACLPRNLDEMGEKSSSTVTNQDTRPWYIPVWGLNLYYSQCMIPPNCTWTSGNLQFCLETYLSQSTQDPLIKKKILKMIFQLNNDKGPTWELSDITKNKQALQARILKIWKIIVKKKVKK